MQREETGQDSAQHTAPPPGLAAEYGSASERAPRPRRTIAIIPGCFVLVGLLLMVGCISLYVVVAQPRLAPAEATLQVTQPMCGIWHAISSSHFGPAVPRVYDLEVIAPDNAWGVGAGRSTYHWDGSGWKEIGVPDPNLGGAVSLFAVSALPNGEVWAVGSAGDSSHPDQAVAYRWDGSQWLLAPVPAVAGASTQLRAVKALSSSDVWAVGQYLVADRSYSLSFHWDGTGWTQLDGPHDCPGNQYLRGLDAFGSQDVWAVGSCSDGTSGNFTETVRSLVQRWDGSSWTPVPAPVSRQAQGNWSGAGAGGLDSISATAPNDIWAAGTYMATDGLGYFARPLLFHWDGARWSETDLTQASLSPLSNINDIKAVSRNDAWAVGDFLGGDLTAVVLHWDGKSWQRVPVANPLREGQYTAVGVLQPGRVWAMGFGFDDEDGEFNNLSAHFDVGPCPGQAGSPTTTAVP